MANGNNESDITDSDEDIDDTPSLIIRLETQEKVPIDLR